MRIKNYKIKLKNFNLNFRLIEKNDEIILGDYFLSLSDKSKKWFSPHSFDRKTAKNICYKKDKLYKRIIVIHNKKIVGYCVLSLEYRYWEKFRYKDQFLEKNVCEIAPSVLDCYQNMGIGKEMVTYIIKFAKSYNKKVILLWGGVVVENDRAFNFYKKLNFQIARKWFHPQKKIYCYDMFLGI